MSGEPTNSVANGATEHLTGKEVFNHDSRKTYKLFLKKPCKKISKNCKKTRKNKKDADKKIRGFKSFLNEQILYRGHNPNYDYKGLQSIVWTSTRKSLAILYGYQQDTDSVTITQLEYKIKNSFDAGTDRRVLTISEFLSDILHQSHLNDSKLKRLKPLFEKLVKQFGDKSVSIITFWNEADKLLAEFLVKCGFDSIKVNEKGVATYGIIRKFLSKADNKIIISEGKNNDR